MCDERKHNIEHSKHRDRLAIPVFLVLICILPFVAGFFVSNLVPVSQSNDSVTLFVDRLSTVFRESVPESFRANVAEPELEEVDESVFHTPLPDEVRAIYWTASTAGSSRGDELLEYMLETGLNSVVIDAKMDNGELAFDFDNTYLDPYEMDNPPIEDFAALLDKLGEAGIYRIARVAVMRDRAFSLLHPKLSMRSTFGGYWYDSIGSLWVDPAAEEVAEYAVVLGEELYQLGFDEIQYDYVRFASDGAVSQIVYPVYDGVETKVEVMQRFFKTVGEAMKEKSIPVSFDLFGMTFWSHNDYNIGQRLVDVLPYADWISPMVYPSHYPDGFEGYANPAVYPYEIVKLSLDMGTQNMLGLWSGTEEELRSKWRPWLQDFDIGAVYTSDLIEAQIQATRDAGASGWILWNARNVYESAQYTSLDIEL